MVDRSRRSIGGGARFVVSGILNKLIFIAISLSLSLTSVQSFQTINSISTSSRLQIQHHIQRCSTAIKSTTSETSSNTYTVTQQQSFILDGGELQSFLLTNDSTSTSNQQQQQVGVLSLVTGKTNNNERIIGVVKSSNDNFLPVPTISLSSSSSSSEIEVYKHTIAKIPQVISDKDALSTAAACLVGIHCSLPIVEDVGGSSDDSVFYGGKAVVLGGNDYACFIADGLSILGIDVSLISTSSVKTKNKNVKILKPAVNVETEDLIDTELGFANAIGQFDSLIDTIANERKGVIQLTSDDLSESGSSVLQLLQSRHGCDKYISTLTQSQQMIKTDGVLFGPGKANSYVKDMESISTSKCIPIVPSSGFGSSTLQVLLENNVIYSSKNNKSPSVRGWELKDFWEETSWPRDSSGTGIRYGLPVEEEEDLDEQFRLQQMYLQSSKTKLGTEGGMDDQEVKKQTRADDTNPYVEPIIGTEGLAETIISPQRSGVVFVAMKSCRTCKGINPQFTRIARDKDTVGSTLLFAKADASGAVGKALGKQLGVVAVPSFVLFRNGVRYGAVFTSKLPSDRLNKAIMLLEAGEDFDTSLEEEDKDD